MVKNCIDNTFSFNIHHRVDMSLNSSLLTWKILMLTVLCIIIINLLNSFLNILPVSGFYFNVCFLSVWFLSLILTLIVLHKILEVNKPIDLEFSKEISRKCVSDEKHIKTNTEALNSLTDNIVKYYISKWYNHISDDNDFSEETKHVTEEILSRFFQVMLQLDNKIILHGILNILLKHLKEFRRTLKRKEKYGSKIEELYRYSHSCCGTSTSKNYYLHQLTINLLHHFINWELWNSLPCQILASIISKKCTLYILNLVTKPEFLNYQILNIVSLKTIKTVLKLNEYNNISFQEAKHKKLDSKDVTDVLICPDSKTDIADEIELKVNEKALKHEEKESNDNQASVTNITTEKTFFEDQSDRILSDPVKIYEPKSASKKWKDSKDLASISFGTDPLETFITEKERTVLKSLKLTKNENIIDESPTNTLLSEVRHMTSMEGLKSSIKPISEATVNTLHNIKDLQESTVNNALHKIGDFQDEAAGVVGGILDFGRAGLRKGLRLTGLQDNIENAKAALTTSHKQKKKPIKLIKSNSIEKTNNSDDSMESCWINPLQLESPNFDGQILLEKGKQVYVEKCRDEVDHPLIPHISAESENDSPDPEYEEPSDLESTIAKLRSLLQQKSSESSLSTPAVSPMPIDEFGQRLVSLDNSNFDEADGVVPSFYKFCTKTATGYIHKSINTIKTALPGNTPEQILSHEQWNYAKDESSHDFLNRMNRLLCDRKDFCQIDRAYEAIDSLESTTFSRCKSKLQFEDELDDFEVRLPITKALIDILCELLADCDTPMTQEPIIQAVLLSFGNTIENTITNESDRLLQNVCKNLFDIPERSKNKTLYLSLEMFINTILSSFPDYIKYIFNRKTLVHALSLLITSFQHEKINQDIFLQIFDLLSMKLTEESIQFTPPLSAV